MGLYILGTGLLAEELSALAEDMAVTVEAFVENLDRSKAGTTLCERPVIWVDSLQPGARCVCALSTTKRKQYVEQVQDRAEFVDLIHPSSTILPRALRLAPGQSSPPACWSAATQRLAGASSSTAGPGSDITRGSVIS